jgi:hypothetical protein
MIFAFAGEPEKESSMVLNETFEVFQELLIDILQRQAIWRQFEANLKGLSLKGNDLIRFIFYGYIISQLSDLRKFFDTDNDVYQFKLVVKHLQNADLKGYHETLFKQWKSLKMEKIANKHLLHLEKEAMQTEEVLLMENLGTFVEQLAIYLRKIEQEIGKNFHKTVQFDYDAFLENTKEEVNLFFKEIKSGAPGRN